MLGRKQTKGKEKDMGFGNVAVGYVPRTTNYKDAKRLFDSTKPIKGRADNKKPLGRRKDVDSYWIRENNENGVAMVQYMCYRTPVVSYYEDGRIKIDNANYNTQTTNAFIYYALGLRCDGKGGYTNVHISGKTYQLTPDNNNILWVKEEGENYKHIVLDKERFTHAAQFNYRINRKKANNVRAKYAEFIEYFKAFLALRDDDGVISFEYGELVELFGEVENQWGSKVIQNGDLKTCMRRAGETRWGNKEGYHAMYLASGTRIIQLITSTNHADFYKAAMTFVAGERVYFGDRVQTKSKVSTSKPEKDFNEFLMRWHAEDVLDKFELEAGVVPTGKYKDWL
jgi:hypothetical protein